MGNVIERLLNLKMHYILQTGTEPTRLTLGREVAEQLADEMLEIEAVPAWQIELPHAERKARLLRQVETGDVSLWGVQLEAGWL